MPFDYGDLREFIARVGELGRSPVSLSTDQTECPMRVCRLHLADLFLGITAPSQFGFLRLGNNERHPCFRFLMRGYRGLESALRVISDIRRIRESSRLWSIDMLQKRLYCL